MKSDTDDGWNELARELGLEQPARPTIPAPEAEPDADDLDSDFAPSAEAEPEYEADSDLESESEADGDSEESGEDDPASQDDTGPDGPKKKRRRRRRRRRKGGEIGEAPTSDGVESTSAEEGEDSEDATADDGEYEDEAVTDADADGPTAEAARELIANWDVPSWEQIVAGLYRPGGR